MGVLLHIVNVEIWSDIACPWCAVGKRRFETALAGFAHRDGVEVRWRSFELDPEAPAEREGDMTTHLATKYRSTREQAEQMQRQMTEAAAAEGLDFHFERTRSGNTFDAHRLLQLAAERGRQHELKERLFRAYLTEGEPIADPAVLTRLAADSGLDADEVQGVLDGDGDGYRDAVRADEREAAALGITAVPFFVIDRRYGIAGAHPAPVLLGALEQAWAESHPVALLAAAAGDGCADGSCPV